ncbi:MAG: hypothetical protein ACKOUM_10630, partial [Sphingopyxis sp.]
LASAQPARPASAGAHAAAGRGDAASAPARGTAQRTAILDALRPRVEQELGRPVEFVVTCLRVNNGWAFANVQPRQRGGRAIDPRILRDWRERDGLTTTALLRFRNGRWVVQDHAIGATDVWYDGMAPAPLMRQPCR